MSSQNSRAINAKINAILRSHVHKSYAQNNYPEAWRNLPEIPSSEEIRPHSPDSDSDNTQEKWDDYQKEASYDPKLPFNIIDGPWGSKIEYIGAHYQILREDSVAALRRSVSYVKEHPDSMETEDTFMYTQVTFQGLTLSRIGVGFRVAFSTDRCNKQIRWEQSDHLKQGTIVALTTHRDLFNTICKVAVVAARPLAGLEKDPPEVDIFWGDPNDAEFDPAEKYLMVEATAGYFEAYRHVLVGMQKLPTEKFTLANHLVDLDRDVKAPKYIEENSYMDLTSLQCPDQENDDPKMTDNDIPNLWNVDVLRNFPRNLNTSMDDSQMAACRSMLTKRVSIVQGPPGTGKTFTSVSTLRVLIESLGPDDPPIIVAAQTNHALDQLLNHIMKFEKGIVRLGGRADKDNTEILKRTLYELRQSNEITDGKASLGHCKKEHEACIEEMRDIMGPILEDSLIHADTLLKYGLITDKQHGSLNEEDWSDGSDPDGGVFAWLTENQLTEIPGPPQKNLGLPMEEEEVQFEQPEGLLAEIAAEARFDSAEENTKDALSGIWIPFGRRRTGRHHGAVNGRRVKQLLKNDQLWDIPQGSRGEVYRFWEKKLNEEMARKLRAHLKHYQDTVRNYQVAKWFCNTKLIQHLNTKVIGCTTTGLSKYRGLISALQPKILLIEEAAETLEGYVVAGMVDSLEHLVLVGDHKQLQANCTMGYLENEPYNMKVSLFERLVNNSFPYVMLNKQRRMIPDIRKLLCIEPAPFYRNLTDHESVRDRIHNRPPVPGMGGLDTYFFHHNWPEATGSNLSKYNRDEAEMIAGFYHYLVFNGVSEKKITVLTFYNGQRKRILEVLKDHKHASGLRPNVFTVDSYQGEENEIILLSLVRSNLNMGIGFLNNKNRLTVGLSRARRGLYLFGNAVTLSGPESDEDLSGRDPLWLPLLRFMGQQTLKRFDVDDGFPITCTKHGNKVIIQAPVEWDRRVGGCNAKCNEPDLPCGHPCPLTCHPFDHSTVICSVECPKILQCGHRCSQFCGTQCFCKECGRSDGETGHPNNRPQKDCVRGHDWEENEEPIPGPSQQGGIMKRSGSQQLQSRVTFARGNRTPSPEKSSLFNPKTTPRTWRSWDAKQADAQAAEQARSTEAARPKTDKSTLVFQETWHPTTTDKNGNRVRATCGPIKTTVPRFEHEALLEGIESMTRAVERANMNVPNSPATFTPVVDPEDDLIVL